MTPYGLDKRLPPTVRQRAALAASLFAVATWRTRSLSRGASALLAVGGVVVVLALLGVSGGLVPEPLGIVLVLAGITAFPAGWIALGISALLSAGQSPNTLEGASL